MTASLKGDPMADSRVQGWFVARLSALTLAILTAVAVGQGWAADDALVRGTVADPLGARVSGAAVKLLRDGQVVKDASSDAEGNFTFDALASGRYQIEVSAAGFSTRTTDPMFVAGGARVSVDVALPIGPLEESVSVTSAATGLLPSQTGAPVTVLDPKTLEILGKTDVLEALRLVPGSSLVETGAKGGAASMFIRGGNSNFNKVLIDGIPANDIGGGIDLAQFSMAGVDRIEVLREANSVIAGTDALAGVISITSRRGRTPVPEALISLDAGNFNTNHESVGLGGTVGRFDYFGEFAHLGTDNDLPNNKYRNSTVAGRFGGAIGHNTDLSGTVRWIDRRLESPNGASFYTTPDDAVQTNQLYFVGISSQTQITRKWQGAVRVGLSDQRGHFVNPTLSGQDIGGIGFGAPTTIIGGNGYSVTGQGALDFGPYDSRSRSARQGLYAQTTYELFRNLSVSGGGNAEREQAFPGDDIHGEPTTTRNNSALWVEGRGTLGNRVSLTAGIGHARIEGFASRYSPRLSVAASLWTPTDKQFFGDTRLTFNVGKGVKATSAGVVDSSLFSLLQKAPAGAALAAGAGIGPIGPERGRNLDVGLEQGMWRGRARARVAYFNNEFFDLTEFVSRNLLVSQFGIAPDVAAAAGSGAYVNSQSFKAKGVEMSLDATVARLRFAASYSRLDADVTQSLSSGALTPSFNPAFPGIPIGNFSPLKGQRPFRRPANTGNLLVSYSQGPATVGLSGYFAGKANDSTFLGGSDINFGNSLLLPNEDLNPGYQKMDLSASYIVHRSVKVYTTIENLLNQHYEPAFGFPGLPLNVRAGVTITLGGR
jgi:iron complex outermembrane receptor protein/vitamin B12 transporter